MALRSVNCCHGCEEMYNYERKERGPSSADLLALEPASIWIVQEEPLDVQVRVIAVGLHGLNGCVEWPGP